MCCICHLTDNRQDINVGFKFVIQESLSSLMYNPHTQCFSAWRASKKSLKYLFDFNTEQLEVCSDCQEYLKGISQQKDLYNRLLLSDLLPR